MKKYFFLLFPALLLSGCMTEKNSPTEPDGGVVSDGDEGGRTGYDEGGGAADPGSGQTQAGVVTAGEWRDLDNWLFWSDLMTNSPSDQQGNDYSQMSGYWSFYTNNRVAVRVKDANGNPVKDVPVVLNYHTPPIDEAPTALYMGRTDNRGEVNLWIGLTQKTEAVDTANLRLLVGNEAEQPVAVTHWGEEVVWNECVAASRDASSRIDIAFIVDATGSMMDEIDFLKADLTQIIANVGAQHATADIRTAAVFYRDEGDEYLTRESDFSSDLSVTTAFIAQQTADGGGDYPEAVHTALEAGLQKLSWREDDCIRLVFMLLDAPPHKYDAVLASLRQSVPQYARTGIRIIPVAASGVDKYTEFFLRFVAIATDGTYVFITNDSGVGNEHIAATVGEYKVELLSELITRLIGAYLQ